jgi:GMP synthase-like glutamine amidotransferase
VNVLALIHEEGPCSGVFAEAAAARGDTVEEWSPAWGTPPGLALDEYQAVWILGGIVNTHEEEDHPWLREEHALLQTFLSRGMPMLGVCLGGQLIAKACHAEVSPASVPEIGFHEVRVLPPASDDPLFSGLPERIMALQWHYYRFAVPAGAVTLAENALCPQAYRIGDVVWGLQFHPETTRADWLRWIDEWDALDGVDKTGFDADALRAEVELHMARWNDFGRELATRFLGVAERSRRLSAV